MTATDEDPSFVQQHFGANTVIESYRALGRSSWLRLQHRFQ